MERTGWHILPTKVYVTYNSKDLELAQHKGVPEHLQHLYTQRRKEQKTGSSSLCRTAH